jgi:uncharacterized YccA/Bax inhibitor family protein
MASSNPAFNNSPAFSNRANIGGKFPAASSASTQDLSAQQLTELYSQPSATANDTDRMTYEDTMVKILISFAVLLGGAAVGWFIPIIWIPAAIIGFVLSLVNIFKKKPSPPLVLAYAAVEGVFVGGITAFLEVRFPGIAIQAVLATSVVIAVTFALFASGKVRASRRATKVFLIAMVGYGLFSLVNLGLMVTGINKDAFGLSSALVTIPFIGVQLPLGVIMGVFVVIMAAYSLVLDFDSIKTGVTRGAPRIYAWSAAFGLLVTVVWLYIEILRIIALLRR